MESGKGSMSEEKKDDGGSTTQQQEEEHSGSVAVAAASTDSDPQLNATTDEGKTSQSVNTSATVSSPTPAVSTPTPFTPTRFVLHLAFASDLHSRPATSALGSPVQRGMDGGMTPRTYAEFGAKASPLLSASVPAQPPAFGLGSPALGPTAAPGSSSSASSATFAPTSPTAPSSSSIPHNAPFGFLSFPSPTLPGVPASSVTLSNVRETIQVMFPPAHLSSLLASGLLGASAARALHSNSYYFLAHASALGMEVFGGVQDGGSLTSASFIPVSPIQESQVMAQACAPLLLLKVQQQPAVHARSSSALTRALRRDHATLASQHTDGSSSVVGSLEQSSARDFMPASLGSRRRGSYDSGLGPQDSLTLLEASVMDMERGRGDSEGGQGISTLGPHHHPSKFQRGIPSGSSPPSRTGQQSRMVGPSSRSRASSSLRRNAMEDEEAEAFDRAAPLGSMSRRDLFAPRSSADAAAHHHRGGHGTLRSRFAQFSARGSAVPDMAYHALTDDAESSEMASHFDDYIQEKSSGILETSSAAAHGQASSPSWMSGGGIRITVTGELGEPKRHASTATNNEQGRTQPSSSISASVSAAAGSSSNLAHNRTFNQIGMDDDFREGSVRVFTNVDDFFKDEERRRKEYDAALAAFSEKMKQAAEQANDAAPTTATNMTNAAADPATPRSAGMAAQPSPSFLPATPTLSPAGPSASPGPSPSSSPHSSSNSGPMPPAQTPLWISVESGSNRDIELVGSFFGLHPLTIEDCQSKGIREKLEVFPNYLFLVFHAIDEDEASLSNVNRLNGSTVVANGASRTTVTSLTDPIQEMIRTTPMKMVVFPSLVLSFHKHGLPPVAMVRRQLSKLYLNRVLNTAWLIHGLLDVVSDSLMPVVDHASKQADDFEDLIYIISPDRQSHKDVLKRMGAIARRITFLRQRLWSKRDVLNSLIEKDWQFFLTGVKVPFLRDIHDHLVIMLHKMDAALEVIVNVQNTYLAVVSIDVAAVSNEGNAAMKALSSGATILLPLSLIASLMGMNVMVPYQYDRDSISFMDLLPFSCICLCMIVFSYYLYHHFKRRGYL